MIIDCHLTNVVLLIPLVNITELYQYEIIESESYSLNLDIDFDQKENFVEKIYHYPILKPPLYSINAPLLI